MSKILDWIKKHIWQTILIGFGLFLLPLILVHVAYKITAISPWFTSTWNPGELITYIAGFEAFVGTIILGMIAIRHNERNIDINNRLLKIEETSSLFERYPNLKVISPKVEQNNLNSIKDLDAVIFCSQNVSKKKIYTQEYLNQQCHRFLFTLKNLSSFNTTIKVKSLILTSFPDHQLEVVYDTKALGFLNEYILLAPMQELQLSFIAFSSDLQNRDGFNANMEILAMNNLKDEFICSLGFLIIVTDKNHLFRNILENTYPLLKGSNLIKL